MGFYANSKTENHKKVRGRGGGWHLKTGNPKPMFVFV